MNGTIAMNTNSRRAFLEGAVASAAGAVLLRTPARAATSSERVRIGVIGCGNQGSNHLRSLPGVGTAEEAAIADIDPDRLAKARANAPGANAVADFRRILDDASIDAVVIATPDHWHAPVALLALAAGKHVYVEKPCAHNIRESQLLRDAAHRSGKIVVHGTQSRANPTIQQAMELLRDGIIGDVLIAKCWNWQKRSDIGHLAPSSPPAGVDYDTWIGPAEWMPFQANRFHYNWHWWYNFGCGDVGNDGIHELDYALWGLGVDTHPSTISATGGKYFFDDDQQFPDTMQVAFEFPGDGNPGSRRMLIYEQRLWTTSYPFNVDSGVEYLGTKGRMFLSKRGKFEVRGERNAPLDVKLEGAIKPEVSQNLQNWVDCIQNGGRPHANMEIAHRTATSAHLANIATRVGRTIHFDPKGERIVDDDAANALLARKYRDGGHWGIPHGV